MGEDLAAKEGSLPRPAAILMHDSGLSQRELLKIGSSPVVFLNPEEQAPVSRRPIYPG